MPVCLPCGRQSQQPVIKIISWHKERAMKALFKVGQVFSTPGAVSAMQEVGIEPITLLCRHQSGDWEEMEADDQLENWYSIDNLQRVFSAYTYKERKFWVITEADRSLTTILLPDEY